MPFWVYMLFVFMAGLPPILAVLLAHRSIQPQVKQVQSDVTNVQSTVNGQATAAATRITALEQKIETQNEQIGRLISAIKSNGPTLPA
jgi:cell division protein FtsL